MFRWLSIVLTNLILLGALIGCAEDSPPTQPYKSKSTAKAPTKKVAPPTHVENSVSEIMNEKFVYRSEGRRDPFVPLTEIRKPIGRSDEPLTPLQRFELDQYRLMGVIVGKGASKAMVKSPDGKAYILTKGLKIGKNEGIIIDINDNTIRVEEKYYDFSGNVRSNIQELKVPRR
ncbi:MAG: pilus assembly protein PilP [Deltaproteobacteria bacterium]|jgi:type IV pilus assembly protein PilP|nr:pilus assembly protein PilP [Deltaproteobacteria bacterium]